MTIQETVKAAIDAAGTFAGTRTYPNVAPDSPTCPYCVYSVVANAPENTFTGVPIDSTRMQVDCYGKTYADAQALAVQVRAAVVALPGALCVMELDAYESDVKLHRVIQDFSIWA